MRLQPMASWASTPRLKFCPHRVDANGKRTSPNFPVIVWYLGASPGRFIAAFAYFGDTR